MGNQLAPPSRVGVEQFADLPNLVLKDTLGGGRFLKTLLCAHDNGGLVIVKVFDKRKEVQSLAPFKQQLQIIRERLLRVPCPHVWPMQLWWESSGAAFMARQHLAANLYDRLSTRPFLTQLEKRWIMFQLLQGISQAHAQGVNHGDLKTENVLLTSWQWVVIADWASYKPTYLPASNPADFSYYFDTGSRRRCYIAPERFHDAQMAAINAYAPLTPAMDIFSLGCVIAELFMDGKSFMDLGTLLAYRRGEADPGRLLAAAGVPGDVMELVLHMIQRDPGQRWSADHYLTSWPRPLFPQYFNDVLHPFFGSLLPLDPDARVAAIAAGFDQLKARLGDPNASRLPLSAAGSGTPVSLQQGLQMPLAGDASWGVDKQQQQQRQQGDVQGSASVSSAAGPAAAGAGPRQAQQEDTGLLLDDMDTLWGEVTGLQHKLTSLAVQGTVAGSLGEDDGICLEEGPQPAASVAQAPATSSTSAAAVMAQPFGSQAAAGGSAGTAQEGAAAAGCVEDTQLGTGMVLVVVLLCTLLRGTVLLESKVAVMRLLRRAAVACSSEVRLQTVVPYLSTLINHPSIVIRVMALRGMVQVMASLPGIPPSDAKVYQDYLFPSLSMLPSDKDELLQVEYQKGVGLLAAAAHRHLLQLQYTSSSGSTSAGPSRGATSSTGGAQDPEASSSRRAVAQLSSGRVSFSSGDAAEAAGAAAARADSAASPGQGSDAAAGPPAAAGGGAEALTCRGSTPQPTVVVPAIRFDQELSSVLQQVVLVIQNAATGSFTTWNTWRAMLRQTAALARLLGRSGINEGLLPIFMSCMNSREWQLRAAFFQAVVEVSTAAGQHSLDAFFVPVLEQAIADKEVPVLVYALHSLSAMAPHLRKRTLLAIVSKLLPLLQHPAVAVRAAVVGAVAAAARVLPPVDVYTRLSPMLSGLLGVVPLTLTDEADIMACLPPYVEAQEQQARLLAAHLQRPAQQGQGQVEASGGAAEADAATAASPRPGLVSGVPSLSEAGPGESAEAAAAACCPVLPYLVDHDYRGSSLVIQPQGPLYTVDLQAAGSNAVQGLNLRHNRGSSSSSGEAGEGRGGLQAGYTALPGGAGEDDAGGAAADPGATLWGKDAGASASQGTGHRRHDSAAWSDAQAFAVSGWQNSGAAVLSAGSSAGSQPAAASGKSYSSSAAAQLLRPRPSTTLSQLGAAVSAKQQQLEEALRRLLEEANAARGDRDAPELVDKQQMERLQTTLARLHHRVGRDVRPASSLLVHKLLALSSRTAPLQLLSAGSTDRAQALSGAQVSDAISAALHTGLMQGAAAMDGSPMAAAAPAAAVSGPSWRPRGVLVSHLMEHRKAVNGLAVAAGGAVLVSCSNDETVKVWDVRRLERDVSFQSRLTYAGQTGRITAVAGCGPGGTSIASASSRGSLHVWQVEYVQRAGGGAPDKYTGISCQRQMSSGDEGAILALSAGATAHPTAADPCDPTLLLYTTQRGGTHALDLRVSKDVWRVPVTPSLGLCTHMLADPQGCSWLLQATSCGWLTLWDTRFLVPVLTWRHPLQRGVDALALAPGPPGRLGLQLGATGARLRPGTGLVYIAAGQQEVGLWDLEQGACHQVLRVLSPAEGPQATAMPPASLQQSSRPSAPLPDLAAIGTSLVPSGSRASSTGGRGPGQGRQEASMSSGGLAGAAGVPRGQPLAELDTNQLLQQLEQQLAIGKIHEPQARSQGCYALLGLPTGQLLAGGSDRCLRYWEPGWPERSYLVAGPLWQEDRPIVDSSSGKVNVPCVHRRYDARLFDGVPVLSEVLVGAGEVQQARVEAASELGSQLRCHDLVHADAITAMCCVDSYTGTTAAGAAGRMLASASRDGCVKVWK